MKKTILFGISIALSLTTIIASAQESSDTELLQEMLSHTYGAPVELSIDAENCQIKYPEIEIKETIVETTEKEEVEEESSEAKTIVTPVAGTTAVCKRIADFNGETQYKIEYTSLNRLIAQLYNNFALPAVKNIAADSYKEEITIVPQYGLLSSKKIDISNAIYSETDEESGLKKEIGNLKNLQWRENITNNNDKIKYVTDLQIDKLNIILPMLSFHFDKEHHISETIYKESADMPFDYTDLLQNMRAFTSSRTRSLTKGLKIKSDLFDFGLAYDLEVKSHSEVKSEKMINSIGEIKAYNFSFTGDFLQKHQQPRSVGAKIAINNVSLENLWQLWQIQQTVLENADKETNKENETAIEEKMIDILDELLNRAEIILETKVMFAQGAVDSQLNLRKKGNFWHGNGKISINNLYSIVPELKICRQNIKTEQCSQVPFIDFIDLTKNNQIIQIKCSDKGVFIGNKKVGEPLKIDLHEILQEDDENATADEAE